MNLSTARENSYRKTTHSHLCSHMTTFLGDMADWWVKDFAYIYCNTIINSTSLYCNRICLREGNRLEFCHFSRPHFTISLSVSVLQKKILKNVPQENLNFYLPHISQLEYWIFHFSWPELHQYQPLTMSYCLANGDSRVLWNVILHYQIMISTPKISRNAGI
jgi:hypothetical protein